MDSPNSANYDPLKAPDFKQLEAEAADREGFVLILVEDLTNRVTSALEKDPSGEKAPPRHLYLEELKPDEIEEFKRQVTMDLLMLGVNLEIWE